MNETTMSQSIERASSWIYEGIWGIIARWLMVPRDPPNLPVKPGEVVDQRHPDPRFLDYLKLEFWLLTGVASFAILFAWIVIAVALPLAGLVLAPIFLALLIIPTSLNYVAMYLRYDTTWYVLSNRSMRIRRGIWTLHETTITYENIQNIHIKQGPLQRWFGISNILVETAGGGGGQGPHAVATHVGILEGVVDPEGIRELILAKVRQLKSVGLGDEKHPSVVATDSHWSPQQLQRLREIQQAVNLLVDQKKRQ